MVKVLVAQVGVTLWDPKDYSLPGSSVHGILQVRILEWVTISFSGDLPNLGIKSGSLAVQADTLLSESLEKLLLCAKTLQLCPTLQPYGL